MLLQSVTRSIKSRKTSHVQVKALRIRPVSMYYEIHAPFTVYTDANLEESSILSTGKTSATMAPKVFKATDKKKKSLASLAGSGIIMKKKKNNHREHHC